MTDDTTQDTYTVAEVAALAGSTTDAIRAHSQRGTMPKGELVPASKGGRHLVFPRQAIEEWLPRRRPRGRPRRAGKAGTP